MILLLGIESHCMTKSCVLETISCPWRQQNYKGFVFSGRGMRKIASASLDAGVF